MAAVTATAVKVGLQAAKSKTGRRVIVGIIVIALLAPIALGVAAISLVTTAVVAATDVHLGGNNDSPGTGEGQPAAPGCEKDQCTVAGDAKQVAQQIMSLSGIGRVTWLDTRFRDQVAAYANGGSVSASCTIDVRILQIIVLAAQREGSAGVSSINRRCTGQTPGAGTRSFHWKGEAVDFFSLDGQVINGGDDRSKDLVMFLSTIVPPGSAVGQSQCRSAIPLGNFHTFEDGCNHQHIQVSDDGKPLTLPLVPKTNTR